VRLHAQQNLSLKEQNDDCKENSGDLDRWSSIDICWLFNAVWGSGNDTYSASNLHTTADLYAVAYLYASAIAYSYLPTDGYASSSGDIYI
jgi:hypothetical protein